ncbi:anticodon nuclease [Thermotomaculum hydrothermale]|uniref:Anticodon nuclease n=1 Tax=Thermotomaculum hydrothermale TaxID=981385 RepID=A0A7R6PNC5_9BACT|nr:AAA family ATPase [Thermotomaculum hydrothermale]BBB32753.1 anticodon nuclease [Thermotomaculum hydrothermale]
MANNNISTFNTIEELAQYLRQQLENKKVILIYAYNGTGKTRLSMAFKDLGKQGDERDTLYFNAFTEDLFVWDNDLENDTYRMLKMNTASRFFKGLQEFEIENRIASFLHRYADFNFDIDYSEGTIRFWREVNKDNEPILIKISRGEENIFIWCFFVAIAQLAIDKQEAYEWVNYIYIDDPISSLDDNNAIAVAATLSKLIKGQDDIKVVISSHHTLFFNVLCNEMGRALKYFLSYKDDKYELRSTNDTPRFYHVAMLKELYEVAKSGKIYTYHFTILRSILEKTATFHGFNSFKDVVKRFDDDEEGIIYTRVINLLSHGNYSIFEPIEMLEENKKYFREILEDFMKNYRFNPELFPQETIEEEA